MPGIAVITEACIDTKDRACVDVCPVQCIYEYDPESRTSCSRRPRPAAARSRTPTSPNPDLVAVFADTILYVNLDECTSCTACYQPDVCPVGAIYTDDDLPDGTTHTKYNAKDEMKGHDHSFFLQLSRDVFAD